MKRLALFFLLSVVTVFGAIVSMEQAVRQKAPAEKAEVHRSVTLTLHAPPKPEPEPVKKVPPKPESKPKPMPKPKPLPEPKPEPKPIPEKVAEPAPQPEPEQEREPQEEAEPQPPTVAEPSEAVPSPSQKSALMKALEEYYSRLYRRISENRRYPAQARRFGIEGEVDVAFEIDDSGRIVDSRLLKTSGNRLLDREAMQIFERISRFEAPPTGLGQRRFEVTIAYTLTQK